jgi:hypothetical protein
MGNTWHYSFSPDGTTLACITNRTHSLNYQLYLLDIKQPESVPMHIMDDTWQYSFSPDSTTLAYTTDAARGSQLCLLDITSPGSVPKHIMDHAWQYLFSPDGSIIARTTNPHLITTSCDLDHIQQIFMLYVLGNEIAGHPVTFTQAEIDEIDQRLYEHTKTQLLLMHLLCKRGMKKKDIFAKIKNIPLPPSLFQSSEEYRAENGFKQSLLNMPEDVKKHVKIADQATTSQPCSSI